MAVSTELMQVALGTASKILMYSASTGRAIQIIQLEGEAFGEAFDVAFCPEGVLCIDTGGILHLFARQGSTEEMYFCHLRRKFESFCWILTSTAIISGPPGDNESRSILLFDSAANKILKTFHANTNASGSHAEPVRLLRMECTSLR